MTTRYAVVLQDGEFLGVEGKTVFAGLAVLFEDSKSALVASMKHTGSKTVLVKHFEPEGQYKYEDARSHSEFVGHIA